MVNTLPLDNDEFSNIIKRHRGLILKICYSYCRHPDKRKDLEQEILMNLWHSFRRYDGRVKLSTWIYTVSLNTAISFFRKDARHQHAVEITESIVSGAPDDNIQDDNIRRLYQYIGGLNEMDRALMLLYLDDRTYREIAEIMGISETNVGTKLSRIKNSLKESLKTSKM